MFLTALWMFLKYKPWKNGNGKRGVVASGDQSIDFWRSAMREEVRSGLQDVLSSRNEEIRRIVHEENESVMEDIRKLSDARNDKIRLIFREEIGRLRVR